MDGLQPSSEQLIPIKILFKKTTGIVSGVHSQMVQFVKNFDGSQMRFLIFSFSFLSILIIADDHASQPAFPGLIATEVFDLGNNMSMHVERRKSCNEGGEPTLSSGLRRHISLCT